MRFRFCWDVDCPDWLLAEISTASKLSSVKLRLLAGNVAKSIHGSQPLKYEVVAKLGSDAKFEELGARAVVAAVRWILASAAGAGVAGNILDSELQQLGLPREHAQAITKVYQDHQQDLEAHARKNSLKVNGSTSWGCNVVRVTVAGEHVPVVQLNYQHQQEDPIILTHEQLQTFMQELNDARNMME
ncbi:unnamed protein product, partial [Meganyctiphanes norvegica]